MWSDGPTIARPTRSEFGWSGWRSSRPLPGTVTRSGLIPAACLAAVLLTAGGCGPVIDKPGLGVIAVEEADNGATIDLQPNQQLVIRLNGNRSTGFQWLLIDLTDQVLETVGDAPRYIDTARPGEWLGMGGIEEWTFRPMKRGVAIIRFEYRRPWENGREAIRSAEYTIHVR